MPIAVKSDDLIHKPENNSGWRESYYFDFYDEKLGFGIWSSIGKKPYKGYSGFTMAVWGSNKVLTGVGRDRFSEYTEEHFVEGLKYECIIPNEQWRITYNGELAVHDKKLRINPEVFLPNNDKQLTRIPVKFDLLFTSTSIPYRYVGNDEWRNLFTGHIDQTGRTKGTVKINDKTYNVDGLGARDRSWGIRDWVWPKKWRYIHLPSDEFNLMLWYAEGVDGTQIIDGFVEKGTQVKQIVSLVEHIDVIPENPKPIPLKFQFEVKTEEGQIIPLSGDVLQITPVVFSQKANGEKVNSWNDRALVKYKLPSGGVAYGNIEFAERLTNV